MTERKLTTAQIEELHEYCYFRQVKYYEVQVELVDHMASAIEKMWETQPEITFVDAMFKVGEQMGGDWGFANIAYEKEKTIRRRYRCQIWQFIGSFCLFPKIVLTVLMMAITYLIVCHVKESYWIFIALGTILLFYPAVDEIFISAKKVKLELPKYPFLTKEATRRVFASNLVIQSFLFISIMSNHVHNQQIFSILFAFVYVFFFIWFYAETVYIRRKALEYLAEQFPQFVKS